MSSNEERFSSAHRAMPSLRQINPNLNYRLYSGFHVRVIAATLATSSSKISKRKHCCVGLLGRAGILASHTTILPSFPSAKTMVFCCGASDALSAEQGVNGWKADANSVTVGQSPGQRRPQQNHMACGDNYDLLTATLAPGHEDEDLVSGKLCCRIASWLIYLVLAIASLTFTSLFVLYCSPCSRGSQGWTSIECDGSG